MKLAMAQMSMTGSMDENLKKSLAFCDATAGSDLLFFPEVQLTPFFPQYAGRNVDAYAVPAGSPTVQAFADKAKERGLYLSPNMYLEQDGKRYDASLWLTPEGTCAGVPLRYNNDKQKKPLFSRGLSVCRLLFNSFSKLKIDENYKEKRRLFY